MNTKTIVPIGAWLIIGLPLLLKKNEVQPQKEALTY